MPIKIGINGMGVLGRRLLRMLVEALWDSDASEDKFDIVAINDPYISPESLKYLYNHDTVYGKPKHPISEVVEDANGYYNIVISGKRIRYTGVMGTTASDRWVRCKWDEKGADYVFDCMGIATSLEEQQTHLIAGAHYVITCTGSSMPADIYKYVYSINESVMKNDGNNVYICPNGDYIALSLLLKVLNEAFTVEMAIGEHMTSYTNGNNLQDSALSETEPQIGRAGAWNIIPCKSNVGREIGLVIPELNGKVVSFEHRCGTIAGSHTDAIAYLKSDFDASTYTAVGKGLSSGIMYFTDDVIETSSDAIGEPAVLLNPNNYTLLAGTTLVRAGVAYDAISVQANNAIRLALAINS